MYHQQVSERYLLRNSQPQDAKGLEALQRKVFPNLSAAEILTEQHYLHHMEVFPEGQFVVLDQKKIIATSAAIRSNHGTESDHTFLEVSGNLWFDTHEPDGQWLYGMDMGVDPDYRKQGLARAMYGARQQLCHDLQLRGQMIVGMLNGYQKHADRMSIDAYGEQVLQGKLVDPTIAAQLKSGFRMIRVMKDYLNDPTCGNAGMLMLLERSTSL